MKVELHDWYAVLIDGTTGPGFACGENGVRALYGSRKTAMEFCKELRQHLRSKCKVVKVQVKIMEIDRG